MLRFAISVRLLVMSFLVFAGKAVGDDDGGSMWTVSRLAGSPEPPLPYTAEKTLTQVPVERPIYVSEVPGGAFLVIVQERKPLLLLPNDLEATEGQVMVFADPGGKELVYSIAFDPQFESNGYVYFFFKGNRIVRYLVRREEPSLRIDTESELEIIAWRSNGHDGGDLAFGNDGMLYISTGDGTGDSDKWVSGQTLDDLLGAILRIDVRQSSKEKPYAIPADNPFLAEPGARGEIWAYGLRNPWRMSYDKKSSQLWVGNNGQDLWETAHLVGPGENYGWSVYEGSHPFYPNRELGPTPHVKPTFEHHHAEARSLTGGSVYRGTKWADLDGAYIYGDYSTGRIWAALHNGTEVEWHREIADTQLALASFTTLSNGEFLITDHLGNAIHRLVKNTAPTHSAKDFPRKLSETGLFRSLAPAPVPEEGVHAYEVNAPAWNDGAAGQRWMAVPEGETARFAAHSPWGFPDGAALVQTLSMNERPVETRISLRQQGEWAGYSYRWNADGSDAELVPKNGADAVLSNGQKWRFPSRAECAVCHNRAAHYVLGINGGQLNVGGQLEKLAGTGMLKNFNPEKLPDAWPNPHDASADLETRARTYLHVNCSICHVEAGGGNAQIDLQRNAGPNRMRLLDHRPQHSTFGIADAMLVTPGAPERSVLAHRIAQRGSATGQMPPLATSVVDKAGVELIRQWIGAMPPTRKIVKKWQVADYLNDLPELERGRSFLRGRDAFIKTGCAQCHRFGDQLNGSVGPDLTGIGTRVGDKELLEGILEPSKGISEGFAIPGTSPPLSLMPPGMVDVLEKDEILDLLYYLKRNGRPKVAAVVTEYRHNSHADIIVSRLLQTDTLDGKGEDSPLELVSLYTDQVPDSDTSRMLSASHRFPIFSTIEETLTLGTGELAVDGVFLIAEHGDYPYSETGNHVYPKRRFWDETEAVFRKSGRAVPVFMDKHIADNWDDAKHIFDSAKRVGAPLMAGSSLPTTWRRPAADVKRGRALKEIVAFTYGSTDAYGFHALEFVQALAEQRRGGETGVKAVRSLAGEQVWAALDGDRVDRLLFDAALSRLTSPLDPATLRERVPKPLLLSVEYNDGLMVHLFEMNGAIHEWAGAWRYAGDEDGTQIQSSLFWTQEGRPGMHFTWLLNGIEKMILTGEPSWNAQRTLLTSGILDALLQSLTQDGRRLETPDLDVRYSPGWRWREPPPPPPMRPWSEQ